MALARIGKKQHNKLTSDYVLEIDCRDPDTGIGLEMQFVEPIPYNGSLYVGVRRATGKAERGAWRHSVNRDDTIDKVIARFQQGNDDELAGRSCGNCGEVHFTADCPYPKNGGL